MPPSVIVTAGPVRVVRLAPGPVQVVRVAPPQPVKVLSVPQQGRPGPPGLDTSASVQKITAAPLGGHRVVRQTATGPDYADCAVLDHQDSILGLTTGAAAAGAAVTIQRAGEMTEPSWNWLPGPVFLARNGLLTQLPLMPPNAAFLQAVGFSTAPQTLYVALRDPLTLKD